MSNPNTVTVYSPEGEPFEMSRVNARDLVRHAGWSLYPTAASTHTPAAEPENTHATDGEGSIEDTDEGEDAGEGEGEDAGEGEGEDEGQADDALVTIRKTEADFADLEDRAAVVAYLADAFPDFKPHHLTKREGLIAKAIELAAE